MSNLPVQYSGLLPSRVSREASKQIRAIDVQLAVTKVAQEAKIDAIEEVTHAALIAASRVSSTEALLVSRLPHASGRLEFIASSGCAAMGDIVLRLAK